MSDTYLTHCPIHPTATLLDTKIHLPEGALRQCTQCAQYISQCTSENYFRSMEEFNVPKGTFPQEKSLQRSFSLHAKRLKKVQRMLNKPFSDIHLLDVGCSSGAFLQSAKALGCQVEGVEPAPPSSSNGQSSWLDGTHGTFRGH